MRRPTVRRNVAPAVIEVALLLLPYVLKSVAAVAQVSLARFNRLPRTERAAFVRATLKRRTWFAASPAVWLAAQQAAKSPEVVNQLVDLLSAHGDVAVSTAATVGGAAAGVAARRYAAPSAVPVQANGVQRPVPGHIRRTPRRAALRISAIGVPGRWPIGDLYHARLALVYALAPVHAGVRAQVVAAVKRNYPQYAWDAWLAHRGGQPQRAVANPGAPNHAIVRPQRFGLQPVRVYFGQVRPYAADVVVSGDLVLVEGGRWPQWVVGSDAEGKPILAESKDAYHYALAALKRARAHHSVPAGGEYVPPKRVRPRTRRNGPTLQEPYYPFPRKEAQYRDYKDSELAWALRDAIEARDAAAASARAAERQHGRDSRGAGMAQQSEGWYADDVHTIHAEMQRRGMTPGKIAPGRLRR